MNALLQDLRYALRALLRAPGFTIAVMLTLALGIGGNAAVFSALELALLRPLPYPEADRLVALDVTSARPDRAPDSIGWSYPKFETMRGAVSLLEHVTARRGAQVTVVGGAEAVRVRAEAVSPGYFTLLGAGTVTGRVFRPDEDAPDAVPRVVVLSHALWHRAFGGDSSLVGRTVRVDGVVLEVVGVAQAGFAGLGGDAEAWVPVRTLSAFDPRILQRRWAHSFTAFARLRPGVSLAQAAAEMDAVGRAVEAAHPMPGGGSATWGAALAPLGVVRVNPVGRRVLLVLAGAVLMVLLLACVNITNMLLARAASRERELVIRSALGAGRRRLARQLITESLLLAVGGGALGLVVAAWGVDLLRGAIPDTFGSRGVRFLDPAALRLDGTAMALAAAVTLLTGFVMGLVPGLRLSRPDATTSLRAGASVARGMGSLRRPTLRGGLVAAQVALAAVLLAGAALMMRSLAGLSAVDPGFQAQGVLSLRYGLPRGDTAMRNPALFHAAVLERLGALPGVRGVALSGCAPLEGCYDQLSVREIDGRAPYGEAEAPHLRTHYVSDDYFRVLGIPVRAGRGFGLEDQATSQPVVVLSESAARHVYGSVNALGRGIVPTIEPFTERMGLVVGIVGDVKQVGLREEAKADAYVSLRQSPYNEPVVFLRTAGDPLAALPAVRVAMRELAPDVPLYDVRPLPSLVRHAAARERLVSTALGAFAALGLALAAIGVYGVLSFSVAQRTREVGVRMALGARAADVVRLVVGQGLAMAGIGLAAGLALTLPLTRTLRGLLFGVAPRDPATLVAVLVTLLIVALAAALLPALRAARTDPLTALRAE